MMILHAAATAAMYVCVCVKRESSPLHGGKLVPYTKGSSNNCARSAVPRVPRAAVFPFLFAHQPERFL